MLSACCTAPAAAKPLREAFSGQGASRPEIARIGNFYHEKPLFPSCSGKSTAGPYSGLNSPEFLNMKELHQPITLNYLLINFPLFRLNGRSGTP
jgi:hypothetical protein